MCPKTLVPRTIPAVHTLKGWATLPRRRGRWGNASQSVLCLTAPGESHSNADSDFLGLVGTWDHHLLQDPSFQRDPCDVGVDIYTLLCVKQTTNENLLHSIGNSISAPWWSTWEGKPKKTEGICVHVWLIHSAVEQKPTQHCKATVLQ